MTPPGVKETGSTEEVEVRGRGTDGSRQGDNKSVKWRVMTSLSRVAQWTQV